MLYSLKRLSRHSPCLSCGLPTRLNLDLVRTGDQVRSLTRLKHSAKCETILLSSEISYATSAQPQFIVLRVYVVKFHAEFVLWLA